MKKLILGAAALTLMFTACKKEDENGTPSNSWKVGATEYTSLSTTGSALGSTYILSAATGNGAATNTIGFYFKGGTAPVAGTYRVVEDATAANQVSFVAAGGSASTASSYESTGSGVVNATVTVDGGKVKISMPSAWAKNTMNANDSVQVSANVSQN